MSAERKRLVTWRLQFSVPLPTAVSLVCYGEFENLIQIDGIVQFVFYKQNKTTPFGYWHITSHNTEFSRILSRSHGFGPLRTWLFIEYNPTPSLNRGQIYVPLNRTTAGRFLVYKKQLVNKLHLSFYWRISKRLFIYIFYIFLRVSIRLFRSIQYFFANDDFPRIMSGQMKRLLSAKYTLWSLPMHNAIILQFLISIIIYCRLFVDRFNMEIFGSDKISCRPLITAGQLSCQFIVAKPKSR